MKPKISKILFYILLFCLPLGTRKIFFTSQSFYYGTHVFYNSIYLYLTDIVFFGLIITWLWKSKELLHRLLTRISQDQIYRLLVVFWLILAISVIVSRETLLGTYGFVRFTQYFLLFVYIRENINISRETFTIFWLILLGTLLQAILGIFQYLGQSWLGLRVLGEEYLIPGVRGMAEFVSHGIANPLFYRFFPYLRPISDQTYNLRAYGTLPHPNVLAGFLFAGLIINLYLLYNISPALPAGRRETHWGKQIFLSFSLIVLTSGMVVTFSRLGWLLAVFGVLIFIFLILRKLRRPELEQMRIGSLEKDKVTYFPEKIAFIGVLLLVVFLINLVFFGPQIRDRLTGPRGAGAWQGDQSVFYRKAFNQIAWQMIQKHPVLGVGVKNIVVRMGEYSQQKLIPSMLQPVHNIYLLVAAESGVLSLLVLVLAWYYIVRHAIRDQENSLIRFCLLIIFSGFAFWGLFDHYFVSINQGGLLLWLVLGLLAAK